MISGYGVYVDRTVAFAEEVGGWGITRNVRTVTRNEGGTKRRERGVKEYEKEKGIKNVTNNQKTPLGVKK